MQKGRKQKTTYSEVDLLYAKKRDCSLKNKQAKAKKLKRQMNRRERKMQKKRLEEEIDILENKA